MRRSLEDLDDDYDSLVKMLRQKKRTMPELVKKLGRNRTTIYRWMRELQKRGVTIERCGVIRPTLFQLAKDQIVKAS